METSLPLFCEEEEPPCHPVTHDVNNSLPPLVERGGGEGGVDHEGMSHAGRGGGCGERIKRRSFLCSCESPVEKSRSEFELKRIPF